MGQFLSRLRHQNGAGRAGACKNRSPAPDRSGHVFLPGWRRAECASCRTCPDAGSASPGCNPASKYLPRRVVPRMASPGRNPYQFRVNRETQTGIADDGRLDALPVQMRFEAAAGGFDFRQFGHKDGLAVAPAVPDNKGHREKGQGQYQQENRRERHRARFADAPAWHPAYSWAGW